VPSHQQPRFDSLALDAVSINENCVAVPNSTLLAFHAALGIAVCSLRAAKKRFSAHPESDQRLLTHYFHAASNYPLQHGWHAILMPLVDRSPRTARKVLAVPRSSDLNGRFARLLRFEPQLGAAHAPARSNVSVRSGLTGALNRGPPSSASSAWPSAN
jgi:hypothetical protein